MPRSCFNADKPPSRTAAWTKRSAISARCFGLIRKSGAAYANLGVVYMRRKQWTKTLETLQQAERLMPQVAGIRLNIGLA